MTADDLNALMPDLEAFYVRFHRYFCRSEGRAWGQKYLIGLALTPERRNAENIAERIGAPPRKLQEFLSDSPWDDEGCVVELQRLVGELFGTSNGVLVLDDTGFAKQGRNSAGVARQYSGTLGRTGNCQIGVFLGYASSHGHTLVDRRLYIHESWFGQEAARRRQRAGLPTGLEFRTKPELGAEMIEAVQANGHLPFQWVAADAGYGDHHDLRQFVAEQGKWYCFEVSKTTQVWSGDPDWEAPRKGPTGRPRTRPRPKLDSPEAQTVAELTANLPAGAWARHRVTEGARGPREYEFVRVRVVEKRHREPGPWAWMMVRRPVGCRDPKEFKYYLSNAPETVALPEMAWVGCLRWTIEENFELGKGEVGLDEYEVTKYRGWYHHITLCMLALAFLKSVRRRWGEKWASAQRSGDPAAAPGGAPIAPLDLPGSDLLVRESATPQGQRAGLPLEAMAA